MLWCWTLQLAIVAFDSMLGVPLKFSYMIGFLNNYKKRIAMILSYKYFQTTRYGPDGSVISVPLNQFAAETGQSLPFRTSAYLEELELTLTVLSIVFRKSLEFKKLNSNLFELFFYLMTNRTIHLFEKDNRSPDNFKPISWLEIALQKIKIGQASETAAPKEKVNTHF